MSIVIAAATRADAQPWSEVIASAAPYLVQDPAATAYRMEAEPQGTVRLLARDAKGRPVGVARLYGAPERDSVRRLTLVVAPGHRRRGVGTALLGALVAPLVAAGGGRMVGVVDEDLGSRSAATRWGFEMTREYQLVEVDPRTVPDPGAEEVDGVHLSALSDVDPVQVWRLHCDVAADDPSGLTTAEPWQKWRRDWLDPLHRPDLGVAALRGAELVAFSQVSSVADRAWNDMTAVAPAYRGRRLAAACKAKALRRCAQAGIIRCVTGNDVDNAPMVAINARLGYRLLTSPRLGVADIDRVISLSGR